MRFENPSSTSSSIQDPLELSRRYGRIRKWSERITEPLAPEDCVVQSMPDASPIRWHLAHTTWFFETFLLKSIAGYRPFDDRFEFLFNSYYNAVGEQFPRHRRGILTRPGLAEIISYRQHVDEQVMHALECGDIDTGSFRIVELGLQHEQQHQELMLTDVKHLLSCNPLFPAYSRSGRAHDGDMATVSPVQWQSHAGVLFEAGHDGQGFAFDNESPRHKTYIPDHSLASRCVTNGEYLEFMQAGGYASPEFWLSMGWARVLEDSWRNPLYWISIDGRWNEFTLEGLRPLRLEEPVCHVSYFEADAFARWSGARLPTEFEWEFSASHRDMEKEISRGVFVEQSLEQGDPVHPSTERDPRPSMLGNVWEWTSSQYLAYPGFQPAVGALGEYNGKFMCNQFVLRGGSCATSADHIRISYRNFFPPDARWQFSGIRLAK